MRSLLSLLVLAACSSTEAPLADAPGTLRAHVTYLATLDPPRAAEHPESLDRAAAYITEQLTEAGGRVSEQIYQADGNTYRNVIARFGPDAGPRLVVGAHYDVAGEQPGADDNASGVAVLIALAFALGDEPPARGVELVAYPNEEPPNFATGDMGSAHHAKWMRSNGADLIGMLSLEMLGYYDPSPGSQLYPVPAMRELYPDTGDFVAVVGRPGDTTLVEGVTEAMRAHLAGDDRLGVEQLIAPRLVRGVDLSDHRNYWHQGFPAAMVTDTAFFRNPHYHEPTDTPDTLDYERMSLATRAVEAAVRAVTDR